MKLEIKQKSGKPVEITYFVHGTTKDNEAGISTGANPGELSELGIEQTKKLKELIKVKYDAVFCSDLKRAFDSAELMFDLKVVIIKDERLRECNYGDLNGAISEKVESMTEKCIRKKFPNGESYRDVEKRIRSFLIDLWDNYSGKRVAIVAHRAPQLALDVILKKKTWEQAIKEDWRNKEPKQWKPGWQYRLKSMPKG